jgi:hypothetical protein
MIKLFTAISFVGTILVVVLFNNISGYEIHSFNLWFIIPIGALLVGAGATAGMFYGHLRYNRVVSGRTYLIGLVMGVVALYGVYYVSYLTTYITPDNEINYSFNGDHISTYEIDGEQITFGKYLEITRQSSSHQFFFRGVPRGESYETGEGVNTFYFWLQLIGAALGGIGGGLVMLGDKKYCQKCKKYKKEKELFKFDVDEYEAVVGKLGEAITDIPKLNKLSKETKLKDEKVNAYAEVDLEYCPTCFDSYLLIKVMKLNSDSAFEEVQKFRQTIEVNSEIAEAIISESSVDIRNQQKCYNCKVSIESNAKFCTKCGAKVITKNNQ